MKLDRTQFKKILKECIRELISEGAFDNAGMLEEARGQKTSPAPVRKKPAANDMITNKVGNSNPNSRIRELSRAAAQTAAGFHNPEAAVALQSVFEEVAQDTLRKQVMAEGGHGGGGRIFTNEELQDPEAEAQDMAALDALSGGHGAQHWAAVAFGKVNK